MPQAQLDEFQLIERLLAPLARDAPGSFALTDDAALLPPRPGFDLVATTDAMVAGIHYLADDPPDEIGRKLLRVNLSDLASMGAKPNAYLLTLAITSDTPFDWIEGLVSGLAEDQAAYDVHLVGGDTVRAPSANLFSITALGWVEHGREIKRSGAGPSDDVYVSGTIGDAHLGLLIASGRLSMGMPAAGYLLGRFRRPEPRLELGRHLTSLASACLDVSDGLVADLGHLCAASRVGAELDVSTVPLSPAAAAQVTNDQELLTSLITGGDDYELVFTARSDRADAVESLARQLALPLTRIGRIVADQGVKVVDKSGTEIAIRRRGYTHFETL